MPLFFNLADLGTEPGQFTCSDGTQIPISARCDMTEDCSNDEDHCGENALDLLYTHKSRFFGVFFFFIKLLVKSVQKT